MTPAQIHLYMEWAQRLKYEDLKMQAAIHGVKFKDSDPFASSKAPAPKPDEKKPAGVEQTLTGGNAEAARLSSVGLGFNYQ